MNTAEFRLEVKKLGKDIIQIEKDIDAIARDYAYCMALSIVCASVCVVMILFMIIEL